MVDNPYARIPKFMYDRVIYFRKCMIDKGGYDGKFLSLPRTIELMIQMGELNLFNEKQVDKFLDNHSITIKNLDGRNKVTKRQTNKIIIHLGRR